MKKKSRILWEIIFVVLFFWLYSFAAGDNSAEQKPSAPPATTQNPPPSGLNGDSASQSKPVKKATEENSQTKVDQNMQLGEVACAYETYTQTKRQ